MAQDPIKKDLDREMKQRANNRAAFESSRAKRAGGKTGPPGSRIRPLMDGAGKLIDIAVGGMRLSASCLFNIINSGQGETCEIVLRPNAQGGQDQWMVCPGKDDVKIIDTDTTIPNTDTLASLNCADGMVAKRVNGAWVCAPDINDPNTDILASLGCGEGQVAKVVAGAWACAPDLFGTGGSQDSNTNVENFGFRKVCYSDGAGGTLEGTQYTRRESDIVNNTQNDTVIYLGADGNPIPAGLVTTCPPETDADTDTTIDTTREFRDFWCYEINGQKFKGTIVDVKVKTTDAIAGTENETSVTEYRAEGGNVVDPANFNVVSCDQEWELELDDVECFQGESTNSGPTTVTLTKNLSCHLHKMLADYAQAYSGVATVFNEFCGKNEPGYWGEVTEDVLSIMDKMNRCDNVDIGFQGWSVSANGGWENSYQCRLANGSGSGLVDVSGTMGIYNAHLGDNPRNGYALAGLEFGFEPDFTDKSDVNPAVTGTGGVAGLIPSVATLEDLIDLGATHFRLPMRFERLFQNVFASPSNYNMDPTYMGMIDQAFANLAIANANKGSSAVMYVDPHNYGAYFTQRLGAGNETQVLTGSNFPHFQAMTLAMADRWGSYGHELINEPKHYPDAATWENDSQALITALCANGFTGEVYVNGYPWSGFQDWLASHPTPWIVVPANCGITPIYNPHWYFDANGGGSNNPPVGQPGNTPWDDFENETISEATAVCDSAFSTYEDCATTTTGGEITQYKVFRRRVIGGDRPYYDTTKVYKDMETDEIVDVSNLTPVDCPCGGGGEVNYEDKDDGTFEINGNPIFTVGNVERLFEGNADASYDAATVVQSDTPLGDSWSGIADKRDFPSAVPYASPDGYEWYARVVSHLHLGHQGPNQTGVNQPDNYMRLLQGPTFNGSVNTFPNTTASPAFFDSHQTHLIAPDTPYGVDSTSTGLFRVPKADEGGHTIGIEYSLGVEVANLPMPNYEIYLSEIHCTVEYFLREI